MVPRSSFWLDRRSRFVVSIPRLTLHERICLCSTPLVPPSVGGAAPLGIADDVTRADCCRTKADFLSLMIFSANSSGMCLNRIPRIYENDDPKARLMVIIDFNNDIGDYME